MYIPLGNAYHGRLGSPVINPFDDQGLWHYGFSQVEDDKDDNDEDDKKTHLVTKDNPRSIYNGYGSFAGTGSTIVGGVFGALVATGVLALKWSLAGDPKPFTDKLKENWYCVAGGIAMIVLWEKVSGMFRD